MTDAPDKPRPRRRGRTVLLVLLGLFLLVLGSHAYWGHYNGRKLAHATEALRAAGEPMTAADLRQPPVPDDRNAAVLLRAAAKGIDQETEAWKAFEEVQWPAVGTRLPLPPGDRAASQRAIDENEAAFPLVAAAVNREGVDWGVDYTPGFFTLLPDLNEQRTLAQLLEAAALVAHEQGDDARAVSYLEQVDFIGRALGRQSTLVTTLVSCGIAELHTRGLSEIAPDLKVSDSDPAAVPAAQVRRVIDGLLDDGPHRQAWLRGLRGERALQQDTIAALLDGTLTFTGLTTPPPSQPPTGQAPTPSRSRAAYLMGPVIRADALLMLRYMTDSIAAADEAGDWLAFQARFPNGMGPPGIPWRHPFSTILLPAIDRGTEVHYRLLTQRRLTAAALAVRLYAADHDGKLPASLDALVPAYLPRVPLDALAGGGKPIGYVPDPQRPRLYHVGPNGTDDGGRERDPSASRAENERASDEVLHLKHHPRPDPPPVDDDGRPPPDME